jgi:hypothetical protein
LQVEHDVHVYVHVPAALFVMQCTSRVGGDFKKVVDPLNEVGNVCNQLPIPAIYDNINSIRLHALLEQATLALQQQSQKDTTSHSLKFTTMEAIATTCTLGQHPLLGYRVFALAKPFDLSSGAARFAPASAFFRRTLPAATGRCADLISSFI